MTETLNQIEPVLELNQDGAVLLYKDRATFDEYMKAARLRAAEAVKGLDVANATDRAEIARVGRKLASIKIMLDERGKALGEHHHKAWKEMVEYRKGYVEQVETLQAEIEAPVKEWKAKDDLRQAEVNRIIDAFVARRSIQADDTSVTISERLEKIKAFKLNPATFQDRLREAQILQSDAIKALEAAHAKAVDQEAKDKELEAARIELEQHRAAQAAREAIEANERAERERLAAEAERTRIAAEQAADLARFQAEQKAQAEAEELRQQAARAEAAHQAQLESIRRQQAEAEAMRLRAEQIEAEEKSAREADQAHRRNVEGEAMADMIFACDGAGDTDAAIKMILEAIVTGQVRHVKINF